LKARFPFASALSDLKARFSLVLYTKLSTLKALSRKRPESCHAQSLAATNRVTEQLSWLAVGEFLYVLFNKLDGQSY
jgi:hypothetical protein